MIRDLAEHDPTRFSAVLRVRVRDALLAYLERIRQKTRADLQHAESLFVAGGLKKRPRWPSWLGEQP